MPHFLHFYLLVCFLWASHSAIVSQTLQWDSSIIFAFRVYLRERHFGSLCRPMSIWVVLMTGLLSGIPMIVLCIALVMEAIYPTLGGDEGYDDECYVVPALPANTVGAMHPGYHPLSLIHI